MFTGYDTARPVGKEKTRKKHVGEWRRCQKTDDLWPLPRVDYAARVSELLINQSSQPFLSLDRVPRLPSDFYRLTDEHKRQVSFPRLFQSPRVRSSESDDNASVNEHAVRATAANIERYLFDERRREKAAQSHSNL